MTDSAVTERYVSIFPAQREEIRAAFLAGLDDPTKALCCGAHAEEILAVIVGAEHAKRVQEWCYDALGCSPRGSVLSRERCDLYLRKIDALGRIWYGDANGHELEGN